MTTALIVASLMFGTFSADKSVLNDPKVFPIAVWLQEPSNAPKYQKAGFNLYIGLWQGPTEAQLTTLKSAGMPVICEQNKVGLDHKNDPIIAGWMHGDEPDNAQEVKDPVTGKSGYGPCIPPAKIVDEYHRMKGMDLTRPVMLNLGQGVANDEWIGRGNGSSLKDYETYVHGGDIVSYDIYPIAGLNKPEPADYMWYIAKGLDRLSGWMPKSAVKWNCIECTPIDGGRMATPSQVTSEVWMSIIHGSKGLIYFVHQFKPKFDEHALLDEPEMLASVTKLNHQVQSLAPFINSETILSRTTVSSSSKEIPIDAMLKRQGHDEILFTIGMRNGATTGKISVKNWDNRTVEVVGENRTLKAVHGQFSDSYQPYQTHIYLVTH